jgi:hypothetical protein
MITLLDGRQIDEADFAFDPRLYHFSLFSTGEDVTNEIRRADKLRLVPGFDVEKELYRLSVEKPFSGGGNRTASEGELEPRETNTAKILADQLFNDPLGAPLETLDAGVKKVFESSGVRALLIVAALGIAAAIYLKKA